MEEPGSDGGSTISKTQTGRKLRHQCPPSAPWNSLHPLTTQSHNQTTTPPLLPLVPPQHLPQHKRSLLLLPYSIQPRLSLRQQQIPLSLPLANRDTNAT